MPCQGAFGCRGNNVLRQHYLRPFHVAASPLGFAVVVAMIELDLPPLWGICVSKLLAFTLLPDKNIAITFIFYGESSFSNPSAKDKNKIFSWVKKWIVSTSS